MSLVCIEEKAVPDHTLIDKQCFNDIQIKTNFKVRDASVDEIKKLNFNCGVNDVPDGAKVIALEHKNDECILAYMVFTIKETAAVTTVNVHELCGTANNFKSASRFMLIAFAGTFTKTQVVFKFNVDINKGYLHRKFDLLFKKQDAAYDMFHKNVRETRRDAYYYTGKGKFTQMVKNDLNEVDLEHQLHQLLEIGFRVAVVRRQKKRRKSKYIMVLELTSKCEDGRQMREFKKSKRKLETIQPVPLTPHTARRLTESKYLPGPTEYGDFIYADLEDSQRPYDETLPELGPLEELDEELDEYFTREKFEPLVNSGSDDDYHSDDDY